MMIKAAALLGDYWHSKEDAKAGLETALSRLSESEEVDLTYITHEEVLETLEQKPDIFINAKMDPLNPKDEEVVTWLTPEIETKLIEYVQNGGGLFVWHAGMAGYDAESRYIEMLRGAFDYHPPGLQQVTYMPAEGAVDHAATFTIEDEQYFVHCEESATTVDLWSTGVDGDSLAGWKHTYGSGKVCCFTPAHTREGMQNEHVSRLLAEKIAWTCAK